MEMQEIVIIGESIKLASVSTDLDFMSSYSMRKDVDHFQGYEKYGLWNIGAF